MLNVESQDTPVRARTTERSRPVLITGGAGFIGSNLAHRLLLDGRDVILYDNLSRPGVEANVRWLMAEFGSRLRLLRGDTRDRHLLNLVVAESSAVFHFAAQVAVTTSLLDPLHDFDVNVGGTLNVLEAVRSLKRRVPLVYTSTNKVYGSLADVELGEEASRYVPLDERMSRQGVDEARGLDFHSPYGCSKGAADQYVIDYARSYGLPATVFRMSCIYGPRQFGNEDQGWVAHFLIRAQQGRPITIYGDGKQVRDILFITDLVDALQHAERNIHDVAGHAFNIGGGPRNVISLIELIDLIEQLAGARPALRFEPWRTGDQRYYVSSTDKFKLRTGWEPCVSAADGVEALYRWLSSEHSDDMTSSAPGAGAARARAQRAAS